MGKALDRRRDKLLYNAFIYGVVVPMIIYDWIRKKVFRRDE